MPDRQLRQGTGRRADDCEKCPDHSGMVEKDNSMAAWIKGVFAVASVATGLMAYSVFWQAPQISVAIDGINHDINSIRNEMRDADTRLDKRVTCLEDIIYKRK